MLKLIIACITVLPFIKDSNNPGATDLFLIVHENKIGYINHKGQVVLKPVYVNGYDFSDGLAAVRENGRFGFIDGEGKFVLPPQFDFATAFDRGIAIVYKKGKPYIIDKKGSIVFPTVYRSLVFVNDRIGKVTTLSGKEGLIDINSKKLITDTIYDDISNFNDGVAIVRKNRKNHRKKFNDFYAVIDTTGKIIVPFGKYEEINSFTDGYAVVEIEGHKKDENSEGVINSKGNLLFKRKPENNINIEGNFHDGFARVSLYKYWIPEEKGVISTSEKSYEGYINLNGEIVFDDTTFHYTYDFSNGRAFVKKYNGGYYLLDKHFKRVTSLEFEDVQNEIFKNNYAIVQTDNGWGVIDTAANFIIKPQYEEIDPIGILENEFFVFSVEAAEDEKKIYGLADLKNNVIVKPIFNDFDRSGFKNGLLKVAVDGTLAYVNKKGAIVWQNEKPKATSPEKLNIDYMNRGYFYAYSPDKNHDQNVSGGWAMSGNKPHIIGAFKVFEKNTLSVKIDTTISDTLRNNILGCKVFVSNTTGDTIKFNAQDSRLYMKLQAQDENGAWSDIEYLPSSWCGNSYHQVELPPNAYWVFSTPYYDGEIKTKIRAALTYLEGKLQKTIYSNSVTGSINPGQFWHKENYYTNGIMDPYFD